MKRHRGILALLLAAALTAGTASASALRAPQEEKDKPSDTEKQKEKKTKKKRGGREPGRRLEPRRALSRVLRNFTDEFEGLSPSSLRDWVLVDQFYDYPRFEEGVTVFLRSVSEMRVFTREVNVQVKGERAVMIVEGEMTFASRQDPSRTETREARITFDFQRTPEGWKITEISPRSFFLP